ncbi:MAG: motility associated factor glycosyltransferase family protein [Clostridiaceae bacterium]
MNEFTRNTLGLIDDTKKNISLDNYIMEKSKDGKNILRINLNGKWLYNGSKYSVTNDINNFISNIIKQNDFTIFVVFGLGCGEHILKLMDKTKKSNKIIIIEPDINIIENLKNVEDYNRIIEDSRIEVVLYDTSRIYSVLEQNVNEFDINNIVVLSYSNYDKLFFNEFSNFYNIYNNFLNSKVISINTNAVLAKDFFECYLRNIPNLIKSSSINDIKNIYQNKPAIIVSAGPSLEKNIDLLKECQENFVIICSARTIKPLNKLGIKPDFMCIVDPCDEMLDMIREYRDLRVPLVYYEFTNYKAVSECKGVKIFFTTHLSQNNTNDLLQENITSLSVGGSVAHTCTELAIQLGCNPIIFIGQDLAYTDDKSHADITKFGNCGEFVDENIIFVDDIFGGKIATSIPLNGFRIYFERMIDKFQENKFINCTEGGANIAGTEVKLLCDIVEKYNTRIDKKDLSYLTKETKYKENVFKKLNEYIVALNEIIELSYNVINYSMNISKFYYINEIKSMNEEIEKYTKESKVINSKYEEVEFIGSLLTPLFDKFLINEDKLLNNGIDSFVDGTKMIYDEIINTSKEAINLISEIKVEMN